MDSASRAVAGLLLAAGAGRRAGGPKALKRDADGTSWLIRSIMVLSDGGCDPVIVVLGSGAAAARMIIDDHAWPPVITDSLTIIEAADWSDGMGASLRAGLRAAAAAEVAAALVLLVDLPDVTAAVIARLRALATEPSVLARATYRGRPGHPVLFGHDHLRPAAAQLSGDQGAKDYLFAHSAIDVECGDLATGQDRDD